MLKMLKKFEPLTASSIQVPAEPATVYEILTDYDNYLEWFPQVTHSKLMVKEGDDLAIAEFAFDRPKDAKLTMECIHTRNEMVLHRRISGAMPITRVQWNLESSGTGTKVTVRTELELHNWRILQMRVPPRGLAPGLLQALEGRVVAFSSDFGDEDGRKFLEIIQTEDVLEVYFLGRKYKLVPSDD